MTSHERGREKGRPLSWQTIVALRVLAALLALVNLQPPHFYTDYHMLSTDVSELIMPGPDPGPGLEILSQVPGAWCLVPEGSSICHRWLLTSYVTREGVDSYKGYECRGLKHALLHEGIRRGDEVSLLLAADCRCALQNGEKSRM